MVADSQIGDCWNFEVYVGKTGGQEDDVGELGKTDRVVIGLMKDLTYQGCLITCILTTFIPVCPWFYSL